MERIEQIIHTPGIEGIDQQVSLWMNSHYCPFGDFFWSTWSGIKIWIPMYVLVAGLLIWRLGWKKGLIAIACIALAFFFNERINNLIKALVERTRPCNDPQMLALGIHVLEKGGGWSFPSGHACNSFGFAVSSALCLKMDGRRNWNWYGIAIISWAVLVGISRVMVARHFLGDVIVGAVSGTAMGILWAWIAGKIITRYSEKLS